MKTVSRRAALTAGIVGIASTAMIPSVASAEVVGGIEVRGAIGAKWSSGARNVLGNPVTGEIPVSNRPGAVAQFFQRGAIHWAERIGAIVSPDGAIFERYKSVGAEQSGLGLPTRDQYGVGGGGVVQWYENGLIYWSPATQKAQSVLFGSAIFQRWQRQGSEWGFGFPTSEEVTVARGGRAQSYERGTIYWTGPTGPQHIDGAIRNEYWAQGADGGPLGFPIAEVGRTSGGGMDLQRFENGYIYRSDRYGSHAIWGTLRAAYDARLNENGFLGAITSSPYRVGDTLRVNFEGGILFVRERDNWNGTVGWEPRNVRRYGPTMSVPWEGPHDLTSGWNGVKVNLVQKKVGTYGTGRQVTMNAATMNGVRRFQASRGLPQTGTVDERTWNAMGTGYNWNIDSWTVSPRVDLGADGNRRIDTMVDFCRQQVGAPYTWGAAGPYELGYDCSGLALQSMNAAGLYTGLTHVQHAAAGWLSTHYFYNSDKFAKVPFRQARRGDWVFYWDSGRTIRHMALVTGPGRMIHAYSGRTHELNFSTKLGNNFYWIADTAMRPFD